MIRTGVRHDFPPADRLPPFSIKTKYGVHSDVWGWHDFIMYETNEQFRKDADEAGYVGFGAFWSENIRHSAPNGHPIKAWGPSGQYQYHHSSLLNCPSSVDLPSSFSNGARWQDYNSIVRGLPSYEPLAGTEYRGKEWRHLPKHEIRILVMDGGGSNPAEVGGSNPQDTTRWSDGVDRHPGHASYPIYNANRALASQWNGVFVTPRHLGGSNALYLDGHVGFISNIEQPNDQFFGDYWHKSLGAHWAWYKNNTPVLRQE